MWNEKTRHLVGTTVCCCAVVVLVVVVDNVVALCMFVYLFVGLFVY